MIEQIFPSLVEDMQGYAEKILDRDPDNNCLKFSILMSEFQANGFHLPLRVLHTWQMRSSNLIVLSSLKSTVLTSFIGSNLFDSTRFKPFRQLTFRIR